MRHSWEKHIEVSGTSFERALYSTKNLLRPYKIKAKIDDDFILTPPVKYSTRGNCSDLALPCIPQSRSEINFIYDFVFPDSHEREFESKIDESTVKMMQDYDKMSRERFWSKYGLE